MYVCAYDEDDEGAQVLVSLFENNLPKAIIFGFAQGQEFMSRGWVQGLIATQGKAEDYQVMLRVADKVTQTEDGRGWVAQVYIACQVLKSRVDDQKPEALAKKQKGGGLGVNGSGEVDDG